MHKLMIRTLLLLAFSALIASVPAHAQVAVGISVGFAPPAIPVYTQPVCPGEGYIWTPGYWAWDPDFDDYYWVPGTWVEPPEVGFLWTPGYWDGTAVRLSFMTDTGDRKSASTAVSTSDSGISAMGTWEGAGTTAIFSTIAP